MSEHEYVGFSHCTACARKAKESMQAEITRLTAENARLLSVCDGLHLKIAQLSSALGIGGGKKACTIALPDGCLYAVPAPVEEAIRAKRDEVAALRARVSVLSEMVDANSAEVRGVLTVGETVKDGAVRLFKENAALRADLEHEKRCHHAEMESNTVLNATVVELRAQRDALTAEVERVREVLAWYADPQNTVRECMGGGHCANCDMTELARTALAPPAQQQEKPPHPEGARP